MSVFNVWNIWFLLVYEFCDVLLVSCAGSFLSLRHLSLHRSLDIPVMTSFCMIVRCTRLGFSWQGALKDLIIIIIIINYTRTVISQCYSTLREQYLTVPLSRVNGVLQGVLLNARTVRNLGRGQRTTGYDGKDERCSFYLFILDIARYLFFFFSFFFFSTSPIFSH